MDEATGKKKKNTIFYAIKNWNKKYLVLYETGIHNNIDYSCLNRRGLHLNRKGSSLVSKNFSQYLNA